MNYPYNYPYIGGQCPPYSSIISLIQLLSVILLTLLKMKKYQLLTLISTTVAGLLVSTVKAQAFNLNLANYDDVNGTFTYDITLDANESLNAGDPLAFTGLEGVTAVNYQNNPTLQYDDTLSNFDSISVNLQVETPITASATSQTFDDVIIISSSNPIGNINYSGSSSIGGSANIIQGPVADNSSAAVPFDFTPSTGILGVLGLALLNQTRKRLRQS